MRRVFALSACVMSGVCGPQACGDTSSEPLWLRQFGTGNQSGGDYAQAAAPDAAGGVFVTGYYRSVGINKAEEVFVSRFDATGHKLWVRTLGGTKTDEAWATASDGSGGAFIAGETRNSLGGTYNGGDTDAFLARYDEGGTLLWVLQLGTSGTDTIRSLTSDGEGGVFVAGDTTGVLGGPSAGATDAFLARYDAEGNQVWIVQFGTDKSDYAYAVSTDGLGGAYVGGDTNGSLGGPYQDGVDGYVARFNGSGQQTWAVQIAGMEDDKVRGFCPYGADGVIVVGTTRSALFAPPAGLTDSMVLRLDSSGALLTGTQFGGYWGDLITGCAPDGEGGVLIGGWTSGLLVGPYYGQYDFFCGRFDDACQQVWLTQFGSRGDDKVLGVTGDRTGGAYLVGYATEPIDQEQYPFGRAVVFRIGEPEPSTWRWAAQPGGPERDDAACAASDGKGGVIVGGSTYADLGGPNAGSTDAWLARYAANGERAWITQFGTASGDSVLASLIDGGGGVFVAGDAGGELGGGTYYGQGDWYVARYDGAGNRLWISQFGSTKPDHVNSLCSDGAGGVYLSGDTFYGDLGNPQGYTDGFVARYDGGGGLLWVRQFGTSQYEDVVGSAPDGVGGVVVTGHTSGDLGGVDFNGGGTYLVRYDAQGTLLKVVQFGGTDEDATAISADGAGGLFLAGETGDDFGGADQYPYLNCSFLARCSIDGEPLWIRRLEIDRPDPIRKMCLDGNGGVLVAGQTTGELEGTRLGSEDAYFARYDGEGTQQLIDQFGTPFYDNALGLTDDGSGGVYIVGMTSGVIAGPRLDDAADAFVVRFNNAPPCPADCDLSGDLSLFDFLCFVNRFNAADPAADCDGNQVLNLFDFLCFVNLFNQGCP